MKKVVRAIVAICLIVVLFSELGSCMYNMFGPKDDDIVSTVGEVISVMPQWFECAGNEKYEKWVSYRVYLRPVGRGNNEELILFTVNCDTEMESEFGTDRSKIPELQVGSVVEITHTYKMLRSGDRLPQDEKSNYVRGYEAFSMKLYEGEYKGRQTVLQKSEGFWWGQELNYTPGYYGSPDEFTVAYVAKVTYPMRGYLVYGYREYGSFRVEEAIWIGAGVFLNSKTRRALESDAAGYTLWINTEYVRPFKNLDAVQCAHARVSEYEDIYDDSYEEAQYRVYHIDEFVGTKNILVKAEKREKYDRYYYFKLDSGEMNVLYKIDDKDDYKNLCTVSADGNSVSGIFPEGGFPGETYITLESLGNQSVSGELVISYCPLEDTDYLYK